MNNLEVILNVLGGKINELELIVKCKDYEIAELKTKLEEKSNDK